MGLIKIVILILSFTFLCQGQRLTATYSAARLPYAMDRTAAYYDGVDSIYLFGGRANSYEVRSISVYSISQDTIKMVGSISSTYLFESCVESATNGNLYYFGNVASSYSFDISRNTTEAIAALPFYPADCGALKLNHTSNIVYIFKDSPLRTFDLETMVLTEVATLTHYPTISTKIGNSAIFFSGVSGPALARVTKLNLDTMEMETRNTGLHTLSYARVASDLVRYVYIIGGYVPAADRPTQTIIQWDTQLHQHVYIPVDNYPFSYSEESWQYSPASVYVEKLNRIYYFGGRYRQRVGGGTMPLSAIWHVNLSDIDPPASTTIPTEYPSTTEEEPETEITTESAITTSTTVITTTTTPNPEIITCQNKTDGMYPHPYDCAMFIGCHNGELEIFTCPVPLLFDPVASTCMPPHLVDCNISCVGKPDGVYPHGQDCSLFITCVSEILEVYRCPPPLLFDPILLVCNYPEFVDCV
ncbi:uncharacterized protein LOC110859530 isoform X2 [Folsomia candida]|uniref:uncharacterized protein LOC110859530 isoform X2 n=1 Tax=Folsomia candida TaxID=158441 RepID=UPI000B8FD7C6|nr:uncharacterized protein LOC110859530 isoform X2 [Folsomia candida]